MRLCSHFCLKSNKYSESAPTVVCGLAGKLSSAGGLQTGDWRRGGHGRPFQAPGLWGNRCWAALGGRQVASAGLLFLPCPWPPPCREETSAPLAPASLAASQWGWGRREPPLKWSRRSLPDCPQATLGVCCEPWKGHSHTGSCAVGFAQVLLRLDMGRAECVPNGSLSARSCTGWFCSGSGWRGEGVARTELLG